MSRHLRASDLRSVCLCSGCTAVTVERMGNVEIWSCSSGSFRTRERHEPLTWCFSHFASPRDMYSPCAVGRCIKSCRSKCDIPANGQWMGTESGWCRIDSWSEQRTFYSPSAKERMAISTICRKVESNIKKNMQKLNKKKKELNYMYMKKEKS